MSGFLALPSTPGIPGKGARRFASVSPEAHFHPKEHSEMRLSAWRNQPSKCALVTASPALANASNCRLNKPSRVELSAAERRPLPAPALDVPPVPCRSVRQGALGDPVGGRRGSLRQRCAPLRVRSIASQTEVVPDPGNSASPAQPAVSVPNLSVKRRGNRFAHRSLLQPRGRPQIPRSGSGLGELPGL